MIADILQAWTKLGTGASTPVNQSVPNGTGAGTSIWTTSPTVSGTLTATGGLTTSGTATAGAVAVLGNGAILPAPVSGTPAQHGLYRDNVVKGWAKVNVSGGTPSVAGSFNVSGITDGGVGALTVTWDRDFASASHAVV